MNIVIVTLKLGGLCSVVRSACFSSRLACHLLQSSPDPLACLYIAMAAKPSTAAEKALHKIQEQVTCGICLEPYTQPKLLKCFHVFCEKCLQSLVRAGRQSVTCPHCRQETPLVEGGVSALQGAFYIHYLFDIQDALQKVSSSARNTMQLASAALVGLCVSAAWRYIRTGTNSPPTTSLTWRH